MVYLVLNDNKTQLGCPWDPLLLVFMQVMKLHMATTSYAAIVTVFEAECTWALVDEFTTVIRNVYSSATSAL